MSAALLAPGLSDGSRGAAPTFVGLSGLEVVARAKVNLALHVTGRREDGYHTLSSLVAFTEHGDRLRVETADADAFAVSGPFARSLADCSHADNIVMRALVATRGLAAEAGLHFGSLSITLAKALPVASGIGGGSADAAALLRIVARARPEIAASLRIAALRLGADVPMCLDGVPALVEGLGEIGRPLACFPAVPCLLVNPGVPVATPLVFRHLEERCNPPLAELPLQGFLDVAALLGYLGDSRNDLEAPALAIAPEIAAVKRAIMASGARFARMSGSGATVFGLFDQATQVEEAARLMRAEHPDWWLLPTRLMPAGNGEAPS